MRKCEKNAYVFRYDLQRDNHVEICCLGVDVLRHLGLNFFCILLPTCRTLTSDAEEMSSVIHCRYMLCI